MTAGENVWLRVPQVERKCAMLFNLLEKIIDQLNPLEGNLWLG
jgi:hypothetical protein